MIFSTGPLSFSCIRGRETCSVRRRVVNVFGFTGQVVPVATIQLRSSHKHCADKWAWPGAKKIPARTQAAGWLGPGAVCGFLRAALCLLHDPVTFRLVSRAAPGELPVLPT